jgi:hypothetical protein
MWVSIEPNNPPFEKTRRVTLDNFLATPMLKLHEHIFTVKDIIKACANIMGGIHIGVSQNTKEDAHLFAVPAICKKNF